MTAKVILIEFNELSPVLLESFMGQGELPNFRRFYESSAVFSTDAQAEPPYLEPWIQWPSVHLGLPYAEHGLLHLGDHDEHEPASLGAALSGAGVPVGVCGSMNISGHGVQGFFIPDPWNTHSPASPPELAPFLHTVSVMVKNNSRPEGGGDNAGLAAFGAFMLRNGLSPATATRIVRQLIDERRNRGVTWRRASALDWLQYDVFRHLARKHDIGFGSFFSNSTAHYQHYHWRNMTPADFAYPPDPRDDPSLRDAVLYGYRSMDRLLARFTADFPGALLVLCTALSQEAWTDSTKMTYRPRNFGTLLEFAGIAPDTVSVEPVMAEEFTVRFAEDAAAEESVRRLATLQVHGRPLMTMQREGRSIVTKCAINEANALDWQIDGGPDVASMRLGALFHPVGTIRSGRHNPTGVLWFRTGEHRVERDPVPLIGVAPTILERFGVPQPDHMRGRPLTLTATPAR